MPFFCPVRGRECLTRLSWIDLGLEFTLKERHGEKHKCISWNGTFLEFLDAFPSRNDT